MTSTEKAEALLARLRERAEAATQGRWDAGNCTVGGPEFTDGLWEWTGESVNPADAAHIAANCPASTLALVESLGLARAGLQAAAPEECWTHGDPRWLALTAVEEALAAAYDLLVVGVLP